MNAKLTLNLNKHIIDRAKDYAKNHKTSLSQLIENYLNSLTRKENPEIKVTPLVEGLTGVIPDEQKNNHKQGYFEYLNKKYS